HPSEVDVAVDRHVGVTCRCCDLVLDQHAPFEQRDVRVPIGPYVHAHEVATRGTTLPSATAPASERLLIEVVERDGITDAEVGLHDVVVRGRGRSAATAPTAATTATSRGLGGGGRGLGCRTPVADLRLRWRG